MNHIDPSTSSSTSPPRVRRRRDFADPLPVCKTDPSPQYSWDTVKSTATRRTDRDITVARVNGSRRLGGGV